MRADNALRVSYYLMSSDKPDLRGETGIEAESWAYPRGGMTRRCDARCDDGLVHRVHAGIPDTAFSIPAYRKVRGKRIKGYVTIDDNGEYRFNVYRDDAGCAS